MKLTVQLTDREDPVSPPMSPMLKRLLSSRVLYAVSLPPPRRRNGIWKIQTWILLLFLLYIIGVIYFFYHTSDELREKLDPTTLATATEVGHSGEHHESQNVLYGVVFDGGSTGTRVHVFELTRLGTSGSYRLTNELFEQTQPGLSSYADNPEKAAESLTPLLSAAMARIPQGQCNRTSVVFRATAGLRLLPPQKADNILSAVRRKLFTSCLVHSNNAVSILDGHLEGLYLWISLNFMTDRLPSPTDSAGLTSVGVKSTVGTIDLGGGSTQITFSPLSLSTLEAAPPGFATTISTGEAANGGELQLGKHVYSHSYLGLGLMSARYSMLNTTTKRLPSEFIFTDKLYSACIPPNTSLKWSHAGRDWMIEPLSMGVASQTLSHSELDYASRSLDSNMSSISNACYAQALHALRHPVEVDTASPVYPPSGFVVHRPDEVHHLEFYAFSYIFDLASSVGIVRSHSGGAVAVSDFRDAADRVCQNHDPANPFACMDLNFIAALLHDGYGFPWDKKITLQKKVQSFEISWGLGAMFAELSARQGA